MSSTVQLTAHFTGAEFDASGWFIYRSDTVSSNRGYATMQANLWDAHGTHVAWTEQLVAVYG